MQRDASRFQLTVHHDAQGACAKASGRFVLGRSTDHRLWAPLMSFAAGKVLTLDLRGVVQLDAAGIGLLVNLQHQARRHGGQLIVAAASARVRRLLTLTRVDRVLTLGKGCLEQASHVRASLTESAVTSSLGRALAPRDQPGAPDVYECKACA